MNIDAYSLSLFESEATSQIPSTNARKILILIGHIREQRETIEELQAELFNIHFDYRELLPDDEIFSLLDSMMDHHLENKER